MAGKGRVNRIVIHPGEILREDFMEELGLSATALAKALGVSPPTVNEVVRGRRGITADMALRLQQYFGTSAEMWMGLQLQYELDVAKATRLPAIRKTVKPRSAMPKAA